MSVTKDLAGYSVFTQTNINDKVFYVSSTDGNDANNGLSSTPNPTNIGGAGAAGPVATTAKARTLLTARTGFADWVLYKRGDTFTGAGMGGILSSGRSASEPILISAYGVGARPIFKLPNTSFASSAGNVGGDCIAVVGLDFYSYQFDPVNNPLEFVSGLANGSTAISTNNFFSYLLVEDCVARCFYQALVFQGQQASTPPGGFIVRRNVIVDNWGLGIFAGTITGPGRNLIEENIFDNNGWNPLVAAAEASALKHNIYIHDECTATDIIGNITANASATGMENRCGGNISDNLVVHNPIGVTSGVHGGSIRRNVILESKDIERNPYTATDLTAVGGSILTFADIPSAASSSPGINDWARATTSSGVNTGAISKTARVTAVDSVVINASAYDGTSLWIAVGGAGKMFGSTNSGVTWAAITNPFPASAAITAVAFLNSLWLAGDSTGRLATSSDGATWTLRGTFTFIENFAYGNSIWMVGTGHGEVVTSSDGITWTLRTTPLAAFIPVSGLAFGAGLFVIGSQVALMYSSPDGITWTARTSGILRATITGIVFASSKFVAIGSGDFAYSTSSDGITWSAGVGTGLNATGLTFGASLFVGSSSDGKLATSPDGVTWTQRTSGFGTVSINDVAFGGTTFVIVGNGGLLSTSTDAITWTAQTSGFGTHAQTVTLSIPVASPGIAVGDQVVFTSLPRGFGFNLAYQVVDANGNSPTFTVTDNIIAHAYTTLGFTDLFVAANTLVTMTNSAITGLPTLCTVANNSALIYNGLPFTFASAGGGIIAGTYYIVNVNFTAVAGNNTNISFNIATTLGGSPIFTSNGLVSPQNAYQVGCTFTNNVCYNHPNNNSTPIDLTTDGKGNTLTPNFINILGINGNAAADGSGITYKDATRTVGGYGALWGCDGTLTGFLTEARKLSKGNYRPQFMARAVNNYIRDGFSVINTGGMGF